MRFTAAHEIGHIILRHFHDYEYYNLSEQEEKILDQEANIVAGELLMSKQLIISSKLNTLKSLAKRFKVSEQAVEVRLKFLGIFDIIVPEVEIDEYQRYLDEQDEFLEYVKIIEAFTPRQRYVCTSYKKLISQ